MTILVNDILAYIILGKKEVALSITNDKKHNVQVKKLLDKPFSELVLGENEFELEIKIKPKYTGVDAYVKSPRFPNPGEYYRVINFLEKSAYQTLGEVENQCGVFKNKFEAFFTDYQVSFICQEMSNYKEAVDEMMRRFYTEMGKKTKKWIPGHRYDNSEGTMYYLGSFLSKKKEEFNSGFYNALEDLKPVHLYVNSLKDTEKTISDVFKGRTYKDIKVIWDTNLPSCVDSGEALKDDSPSLYNLYVEMIENAMKTETDIKPIFDCLCYQSPHDPIDYPDELGVIVKGIVKDLIEEVILNNWNIERARSDRQIGTTEIKENNIDRIKILLMNSIKDGNILGKYYYEGLFKALGINIEDGIEDYLKSWNESDLTKDFDTFYKYNKYFQKRAEAKNITSNQRNGEKTVKITDLFGSGVLGNTILELVEYANNNFGEGVSEYNAVKINRTSSSIACTITLQDLLKFKDSPELREEMLRFRFSKAIIYFDKDRKLE